MNSWSYETLAVRVDSGIGYVDLNRPDVRNAFNEQMIADLTDCFTRLGDDETLRAVVLGGAGKVFSAGADVDWMRRSKDRTESENVADALAMATMYRSIDECPVPVVGRVHRAAFGGAIGLVAACDIVIAAAGTRFSFSEVRLGLIPAVISTLCLGKIGLAQLRRYFVTAEVFTAETAPPGLIHIIVPDSDLDSAAAEIIAAIRTGGPHAVRAAKALLPKVASLPRDEAIAYSAREIARIRVSAEAQAGLQAFLSKEPPPWQEPNKTDR